MKMIKANEKSTNSSNKPNWLDRKLYPFTSRFLNVDGHHIHFIDEGQGPIILFSHAAIGWSFMYREMIVALRQQYRCIAFDYPGFGLSEASAGYQPSICAQSEILDQFIQALGLRQICLLGHDTGGPSAFSVAAEHPDWFRGLILTDTIIFPVSAYTRIATMLKIVSSGLFRSVNAWGNLLLRLTMSKGFQTKKLSETERDMYLFPARTRQHRNYQIDMLNSLRISENYMLSLTSAFKESLNRHPTLLLYGEEDPVFKMGIADDIHAIMPNSTLHLIEGESHFPHEGKALEMAVLIDTWIKNTFDSYTKK